MAAAVKDHQPVLKFEDPVQECLGSAAFALRKLLEATTWYGSAAMPSAVPGSSFPSPASRFSSRIEESRDEGRYLLRRLRAADEI